MIAKNLYKVLPLHACIVCEIFLHISLFSCNVAMLNTQFLVFIRTESKSQNQVYIHTACPKKWVILSNKLDFETLNSCKNGPVFHKIQNSLLQSNSWLGNCACRGVIKVLLSIFSAFHFILSSI